MKTGTRPSARSREQIEQDRRNRAWEEQHDLGALLAIPEGERYISRLITRCGVFGSVFDTHGSQMARKEGRREIGLEVMHEVAAVRPDILADLLSEAGARLTVPAPQGNEPDDSAD